MVAPFALGAAAAVLVYNKLIPDNVQFSSFLLFVAVALSITAVIYIIYMIDIGPDAKIMWS